MVGPDGEELINAPKTARLTSYSKPGPPRYAFPEIASADLGASYRVSSTSGLSLPIPGWPRSLRLLEGEVESELVTDDFTRDLILSGDRLTAELIQGIELTIERDPSSAGRGMATCTIDPAQCPPGPGGDPPHLNLVELRTGGRPTRLYLDPRRDKDGLYKSSTTFSMPRTGEPATIFVHIVLATQTIRSPFRLEHIDLLGAPPATHGDPGSVSAHREDSPPDTGGAFSVSLSHLSWDCNHTVPPVHPIVRMASLSFEVAGPPKGRIAAVTGFRLFELTDGAGRVFPIMPPFALDNPAGVALSTRYQWSKEAQATRQWPDYDSNVGVAQVRLPLAWLPDRIGRARGEFTFREGGRAVNIDVPLDRHDTVTEIVPGVRVAIRTPGSDPDRMPPGWVALHMDTPTPESASAAPKLDSIKFIDADGVTKLILGGAEQRQSARGTVMYFGFEAGYTRAAKLQIRLIVDNHEHTVPFELTDLPFAGHPPPRATTKPRTASELLE